MTNLSLRFWNGIQNHQTIIHESSDWLLEEIVLDDVECLHEQVIQVPNIDTIEGIHKYKACVHCPYTAQSALSNRKVI